MFDPRGVEITAPVLGLTSLPVSTGERHKRDRKLLSPPFQSGTMRNYGRAIASIAKDWLNALRPGQTFSMLDGAQSMALDVILRVVYGVADGHEMQQSRQTVLELSHAFNPLVLVFPWLRQEFGGDGPWARLVCAGDALDALVGSQIRAKRMANEKGEDIMSLLIQARDEDGYALSDREIAQQLRAILFAGHETIAVSIAMLVDMLHHRTIQLVPVFEHQAVNFSATSFFSFQHPAVCIHRFTQFQNLKPLSPVGSLLSQAWMQSCLISLQSGSEVALRMMSMEIATMIVMPNAASKFESTEESAVFSAYL